MNNPNIVETRAAAPIPTEELWKVIDGHRNKLFRAASLLRCALRASEAATDDVQQLAADMEYTLETVVDLLNDVTARLELPIMLREAAAVAEAAGQEGGAP